MAHKLLLSLFIVIFFSGSFACSMNENSWSDIQYWNEEAINKFDEDDMTPLMRIIIRSNSDQRACEKIFKKALKNANLDINLQDKHGTSALMLAAAMGQESTVIKFLKMKEIDVNLQDVFGNTALMLAVKNNSFRIVKKLMETRLCDSNIISKSQKTALSFALALCYDEIASLLCLYHPKKPQSLVHSLSGIKPLRHLSLPRLFQNNNNISDDEDDDDIVIEEVKNNDD